MRYLHDEVSDIREFIRSNGMRTYSHSYDGRAIQTDSPQVLENMLQDSEMLWGLTLPYFIAVSKIGDIDVVPLQEAVVRIESSPTSESFLLIAYQDGGIISVSGKLLPFQRNARTAGWWRP